MSTLRLTIAEGDHFDCHFPPFEQLSVADHIRIYEGKEPEEGTPLELAKARLLKITGAPDRFVRFMRQHEVEKAYDYAAQCIAENNAKLTALARVHETLEKWPDEHDGKLWTEHDARKVMEDFAIFQPTITVEEKTYNAEPLGVATYGQWIDLSGAMNASKDWTESELYARSLAILMHGPDGPYPVQGKDESDTDYAKRAGEYSTERLRLFMAAPWVDVMGCAAFFFSKGGLYAAICSHSMTRFQSLRGHRRPSEPLVIPTVGELMQK